MATLSRRKPRSLATVVEKPEWQKLAAQQPQGGQGAQGQSTEDSEKAFCDLAMQAVANNCQPLMKPQYRVGFEIVHKNDDNTRMAGIFIFRVNKDKYYVPVFFLNGNVKGNLLLYRVTQKAFVPSTPDWCEYLISLSSAPEGHGVPISDRRTVRNQMNLIDIVEPPLYRGTSMRKYAGFTHHDKIEESDASTIKEAAKAWFDSVYFSTPPEESILRRFIEEDGGFNAIGKIANTAREDFDFANALFLRSNPDNYMPELEVCEKKAFAPEPLLVWHQGLLKNANVKTYTEADLAKGYIIEDFRKEAHLNETVFEANSQDLQTVTEPGIYNVLLMDGTSHEMLCGYLEEACLCEPDSRLLDRNMRDNTDEPHKLVLIDTTNNCSKDIRFARGLGYTPGLKGISATGLPMGKLEKDITAECGKPKPESGKAYRVYNAKNKSFSEPIHVTEVKEMADGLIEVTCCGSGYDDKNCGHFFINPGYDDYDHKDKVYGSCCSFVEVAEEKESGGYRSFCSDLKLGDQAALTMMIFDEGYKKATVKKSAGAYLVHTNEIGHYSDELNRPAAKMFLMVKCAMKEPLADSILDKADAQKEYGFFYFPMTKNATNIRFNQWPDFQDTINNDFNVAQQPDTAQVMQTERDEQYLEPQRVGDQYSGGTGDTIDTKSPMELYQMSQAKGNGALFEHGVVGALTKTYDSMAMIDKWLPKMEEALDCIGRTLFLFYWKPEDFSQAYGTDDQSQLENKLVSNFKSLGSLCLEMVQKNKSNQEGTPSLA